MRTYGALPQDTGMGSQDENFFNHLLDSQRMSNPLLTELIDEKSEEMEDEALKAVFRRLTAVGFAILGAWNPNDPDFRRVSPDSISEATASADHHIIANACFIGKLRDARSTIQEYAGIFRSKDRIEVDVAEILAKLEPCFEAYCLETLKTERFPLICRH